MGMWRGVDNGGNIVDFSMSLFYYSSGLNPGTMVTKPARIEGDTNHLALMARASRKSWTNDAQRFGDFDQMHMVHEFAEFTGQTPTETLSVFKSHFREVLASFNRTGIPTQLCTRRDSSSSDFFDGSSPHDPRFGRLGREPVRYHPPTAPRHRLQRISCSRRILRIEGKLKAQTRELMPFPQLLCHQEPGF